MHEIARRIWVEANSPSRSSPLLAACNARFDFDLQEIITPPDQYQVFPDDTITAHCVYDSSSRQGLTKGGDVYHDPGVLSRHQPASQMLG